ncbi:membrane protein [Bacteroidia bacterium]|nr:membrane protein [Bacteroidia bacterium]
MKNVTFFIAKRYLFAKKSHNAINLISLVSAIGVAVGAFALVVVLSVYNGIDSFVGTQYSVLSPSLKITPVKGKVFDAQIIDIQKIRDIDGVTFFSSSLEENALLKYGEKQHIATLCGVDQNFIDQSGIAKMLYEGTAVLQQGDLNCAIVGRSIAQILELHPQFLDLLWIYVPQRGKQFSALNVENAFKRDYVCPTGIFTIEMESDSKYVFVPISLMQSLLNYTHEVSSIMLYLHPQANESKVQQEVQRIVGADFVVKNKAEQNELLYRMMQSEKWAIFFILAFVLFVASFNSVGSLTMLIIEKKKDISTFRALGAQQQWIGKIFVTEGMMISLLGCAIGIALGLATCWVQIHFKVIKFSGNFLLDAYPVKIQFGDIALICVAVMLIGYIAARFPVKFLLRLNSSSKVINP